VNLPGSAVAGRTRRVTCSRVTIWPARPVADLQGHPGVGQIVVVIAAAVIGAGDGGELGGGQVRRRGLAVGEQAEARLQDVRE